MHKEDRLVDLHLHSNISDGVFSPGRLIELAAGAGLEAAAITDHDAIDGVEQALSAGLDCRIEVVPGVEISTHEQNTEIHILGYYPEAEKLKKILAELRLERYRRMEKILSRLSSLGINLPPDDVFAEAEPAAPGRLHLARAMLKNKLVQNIAEAFTLFLQQGRPAFVPRSALEPAQAIMVLRDAGAVPVLAHPGLKGRRILEKLIPLGLRGVEVFHPDHNPELQRYYYGRALEKGLLITGGSDFHGDCSYRAIKPGCVAVPYRYLEQIKKERFS